MRAEPSATARTVPVDASTVAILGLLLIHFTTAPLIVRPEASCTIAAMWTVSPGKIASVRDGRSSKRLGTGAMAAAFGGGLAAGGAVSTGAATTGGTAGDGVAGVGAAARGWLESAAFEAVLSSCFGAAS
jgi:hypothetical protein